MRKPIFLKCMDSASSGGKVDGEVVVTLLGEEVVGGISKCDSVHQVRRWMRDSL